MDIAQEINAISREVGGGTVLVRRGYVAEIEDVWAACTEPDRVAQWFLPVSGDLRLGGHFQLEDNAGGTILRCDRPRVLRVTWVFGGAPPSEVEVRLRKVDGGTLFELEHSGLAEPANWEQFGPGAVGVGWDLTIYGLGVHLAGMSNTPGWGESDEARNFMRASSVAWGAAHEAFGETHERATAAAQRTAAFYVPATE
ncbi:SRPBCC family protein [Amycolatopsis acidicola]|uniref:SRPBCC family protein n=1 Tax=Amycolatopsis acidicola TaxID=2596893 RepID=A0A5N0URY5_9PSEU|nr:SRPBCC family protein [Amycolatopsis acidicola]KAA9152234.1 SRPBCC family protein [Amycolatopsis acidicola]